MDSVWSGFYNKARKVYGNEEGKLVEYALIVALLLVVAIPALNYLGGEQIPDVFCRVAPADDFEYSWDGSDCVITCPIELC